MPNIAAFLHSRGLKLNTDLGQHFLRDDAVLEAIIAVADIGPEDTVVEIGPGVGVLTAELVQVAKHVTAIEIDKRLIPLLKTYVAVSAPETANRMEIVEGNALNTVMPSSTYKIVANIPYHITSPLLRHVFLESKQQPSSLTLLIQREVADKICDTKNAGLLTIVVGLFGTPHKVLNVPPKCFVPPPAVDSAVLHIECFPEPLADAETIDEILKLVKIGFSMKRKMLRNSFGTFQGGLELLKAASIDPSRRPETLSVSEWIALARTRRQA